jgi:hypothetical protein
MKDDEGREQVRWNEEGKSDGAKCNLLLLRPTDAR